VKRYLMLVLTLVCLISVGALAQTAPASPAASPKRTDLYHVHFTKAVSGKAAQLGEGLKSQGPTGAMQGHYIILRHQEGDDWDYCVIEHLGPTTTVSAAGTPATPTRDLSAWHGDTFVSGPAWPDFAKAMGIGDPKVTNPIYVVAVWRAAPGRRDDLDRMLGTPATDSKVPIGTVVLQHVEGGAWTYLAVSRYNSWQDFATDEAATTPASGTGSAADGWSRIRDLSTYHHDTIADRITK
jgi:hypothetical protein